MQEVKKFAQDAAKDLSKAEKDQVNLEERRKHANTKAKKLQKSVTTVSIDSAAPFLVPYG